MVRILIRALHDGDATGMVILEAVVGAFLVLFSVAAVVLFIILCEFAVRTSE